MASRKIGKPSDLHSTHERLILEGEENSTEHSHGGIVSSNNEHVGTLYQGIWPSIEEGNQAGKGAPRRLTMIPQKFNDWCVEASGYHPSTQGGQRWVHEQISHEIKRHLLLEPQEHIDLRELSEASNRLEASMGKMLMIVKSSIEDSTSTSPMAAKVPEGSPKWDGAVEFGDGLVTDYHFDHS